MATGAAMNGSSRIGGSSTGRVNGEFSDLDLSKISLNSDWDTEMMAKAAEELRAGLQMLPLLGRCITVFGSARPYQDSEHYISAKLTGRSIAERGITTLTGGGYGCMEAANQGAKEAGGLSAGFGIKLPMEQTRNPYLDHYLELHYFFVRKVLLAKPSLGFIIHPGGWGTHDELFEVLTLRQTGKTREFPIALIGKEFFAPLLEHFHNLRSRGFISESDYSHFAVFDDEDAAVDYVVSESQVQSTAPLGSRTLNNLNLYRAIIDLEPRITNELS